MYSSVLWDVLSLFPLSVTVNQLFGWSKQGFIGISDATALYTSWESDPSSQDGKGRACREQLSLMLFQWISETQTLLLTEFTINLVKKELQSHQFLPVLTQLLCANFIHRSQGSSGIKQLWHSSLLSCFCCCQTVKKQRRLEETHPRRFWPAFATGFAYSSFFG